jgi:hypothetical protein
MGGLVAGIYGHLNGLYPDHCSAYQTCLTIDFVEAHRLYFGSLYSSLFRLKTRHQISKTCMIVKFQ